MHIKERIPFELLGIDSDNGSEFINYHLYEYCAKNNIEFTRSRAYRRNDSCFVEQKNNSVVRRYAGYYRYDTEQQLQILNEIYDQVRLMVNFFQPSMKLLSKTRNGAKTTRHYDEPKTPTSTSYELHRRTTGGQGPSCCSIRPAQSRRNKPTDGAPSGKTNQSDREDCP